MKFMNSFWNRYCRRSMAGTRYRIEEMILGEWFRCKKTGSSGSEVI